jgi:signal transduction histidine kinase
MQRLPIARSFRLALVGLTVLLAVIAGFGVASLYNSRQRYENTLSASAALTTAAANLYTAGLIGQEVVSRAHGPGAPAQRNRARSAYRAAVRAALPRSSGDRRSRALIAHAAAAQAAGRFAQARADAVALQRRQQVRDRTARSRAASQSRRALIILGVAGVLALLAALGLGSALIAAMRRPLEELVSATRELASGNLKRRVRPAGPPELRALGDAFNAMATELAVAQRGLESERQRLAVVIESLRDALIVTQPGSSTISTVNPTAGVLVPELVVGGRVDDPASPLPSLDAALSGETFVEHQGRTLAVTAAGLGSGDSDEGVVWTVRDTTERARLERAKSEFVATASHELRSPLTSIKGFVELLSRSPENMSERQQEFVEIILKSTDRLTELVSHLLDVARIEADHVEIDSRPVDAGEAVREVAELMGPRLESKKQRIGIYVAPAAGLVLADPSRLRQIVANLITNAHLYTPEGGTINVRVEPERAWIQIAVQDNGVGMTEEQTARVFERFYRAGNGASSNPGTGLGLSIVKSLVELHGGQIDVESKPGEGSTFRVLLPAAAPHPETVPALEAIRGRRVLIVDDEREIAELIAGQLAPLGVIADIATKGEQALELLQGSEYDAVTLDVLMPELGGLDMLARIRRDPRLAGTPIVFVSVFAGRRELAGEWAVSKPIDADELRNVLAAAVESGRSRVLVVGREELRPTLEPALDELGIRYHWELTGAAAARVCAERRFEIALVDVGVRNPQAVLQALDLRGRRLRRAAILFSDGQAPAPPGVERLGVEVVPVTEAAGAVLAALQGQRTETVPRLRPVR